MKRSQIVLTLVGLILVVVLFQLPKVVVDNTEDQIETEPAEQHMEEKSQENLPPITDLQDIERIKSWRAEFQASQIPEKSSIFADSLISLFVRLNRLDSAIKYADWLVDADPSIKNRVKAGDLYYEAFGRAITEKEADYLSRKSRDYLEPVLKENPDLKEVKIKLAMIQISTSSPMQGIMMMREILEEDPGNEQVLFNLGTLSMQTGQYDRAIGRFGELIKYHPDNVKARVFLGISYLEAGKEEEARQEFLRAKDITKDSSIIATVEGYLQEIK